MARAQIRYIVRSDDGPVIQNARVYVFETGTTDAVADLFPSLVGGVAQSSLVSNAQGEVVGFLDAPRYVALKITDNDNQAFLPTESGALTNFDDFTEDPVPAIPDPAGSGEPTADAHIAEEDGAHAASAIEVTPFTSALGDVESTRLSDALAEIAQLARDEIDALAAVIVPHRELRASHDGDISVKTGLIRDDITEPGELNDFVFSMDPSPAFQAAKFNLKLHTASDQAGTNIFASDVTIDVGDNRVVASPDNPDDPVVIEEADLPAWLTYDITQIGSPPTYGLVANSGNQENTAAASQASPLPSFPMPTGYAANDILVAVMVIGGTTQPATAMTQGWSNIGPAAAEMRWGTPASDTYVMQVWWKRAASGAETEPVLSWTSGSRAVLVQTFAVRGCVTTGNPFDVVAASGSSASAAAADPLLTGTGTTAVAGEPLFAAFSLHYDNTAGPPDPDPPASPRVTDHGDNAPAFTIIGDGVGTADIATSRVTNQNYSLTVFDRGAVGNAAGLSVMGHGNAAATSTEYQRYLGVAIAMTPAVSPGGNLNIQGSYTPSA